MIDYNHIESFLDKFKKIISQKEEIKKTISEAILSQTKHEVNLSDIKIRKDKIIIEATPLFKNELLIHKNEILLKINNTNIGQKFSNIS
jgi:hypothetical protein